jgi:heat shock protein beta
MSKDELARNLGTIARSGTSEFLKRAEEGGGADGNLIGQFGAYAGTGLPGLAKDPRSRLLLVFPRLAYGSSVIAPSRHFIQPQPTFVSTSSGDSFEVFPDPRGNTLGRGTEIVLDIQEDEKEWLSTSRLKGLM